MTKMANIDSLVMIKTAENIPFGTAHTYIAHIREYPYSPGRKTHRTTYLCISEARGLGN